MKILRWLVLLATVFNCVPAEAGMFYTKSRAISATKKLQQLGPLTFFKDYLNNQSSANADFSAGSATATVTSARSASNPSTCADSTGVVQTVTSANTARFCGGFYDDTGFVYRPGLVVEQGGTNLLLYSSDFSQTDWAKTNVTVSTDTAISPDGTTNADTLTASSSNGTILQAQTIASAAKTFTIFLKRKTGSGSVYITVDGGSTYTEVYLSRYRWKRFFVTQTLANPSCGVKIATSGDEVYAWGAQDEAWTHPTSYIPTTTAAVTRVKETIKYANTSNRTASTESGFFVMTPFWSGVDVATLTGNMRMLDNDTKSRLLMVNTADYPLFLPNNTDSSGTTMSATTKPIKYTPYTFGFTTITGDSAIYFDGASQATSAGAFTTPAWGTSFYVGSDNSSALQIGGIIHSVGFYSQKLTASSMQKIATLLGPAKVYKTYYISNDGLDTNDGLTEEEPWLTIAKLSTVTLSPGDTVKFKKGGVWRERYVVGASGSSGYPITYTYYGSGNKPIITGADLVTGFTNYSGNVWQATVTTQPYVVAFNDNKGARKGSLGALASEYDFYWASNVLYVYAQTDPDTRYSKVEAANRAESFYISGKSYITVNGLSFLYNNTNGFSALGTGSNVIVKYCVASKNAFDGLNVHENQTSMQMDHNTCEYNGQGRGLGGGAGDGISVHDNVTGTFEYNTVRFNDKAGIDHVGTSVTINRYNWLQGNDINLTFGGVADDALTGGSFSSYYNVIVMESNDSYGVLLAGTAANTPTMTSYNNTIVANGAGTAIGARTAGTLTAKNNVASGASKGIDQDSGATITEDYNLVYGNTTQYEGVSAASHDLSINPDFYDTSALVYSPASDASPLVNSGVNLGLTIDYVGRSVGSSPDIGAYEYTV